MSSQNRKTRPILQTPASLRDRVRRALAEGRTQQALTLAKELYKQEPTPAHRELLQDAYLQRARQLHLQGNLTEAVVVLEAALRVDETNPAWVEKLAGELATCGDAAKALALLRRFPDLPGAAQVVEKAVDAALLHEERGRSTLPDHLHADFDRVLQAFGHLEAGREDALRETLQLIGLQSPFREWKLLLRGLQAYYTHDDARALENWQRLNPERLPSRLAAPFRFQIDPGYRRAQPPATQGVLQQQLDRLQGSVLAHHLRALRAALADKHNLAPAFRQAQAFLPQLRHEAPALVPRLAQCFYWAIMETTPDDVPRYQRVFGSPPEDPSFHRLNALAYERGGDLSTAHREWRAYEKDIAAHPETWPGEVGRRARALIWLHMGENAADIPGPAQLARLPRFLRDHPDAPRALHPGAEACFQNSLELAPDHVEPFEKLLDYHLEAGRRAKAEKAARHLLERFPDHVATLEKLGDLLVEKQDFAEGLALLQRALKGNPLERRLRSKVSTAHMLLARSLVEAGCPDDARREYQSALNLSVPEEVGSILTRWAASEFKAGNPDRGEELLRQAFSQTSAPLALVYQMLAETIRHKLPRTLKARFEREFKEGLAAPATGPVAASLLSTARSYQASGANYLGLKTHVKKIQDYSARVPDAGWTEDSLESVTRSFLGLGPARGARKLAQLGQRLLPASPHFPLLEALTHLLKAPEPYQVLQLRTLLEKAERLAQALPHDERRDRLLQEITRHLQTLRALNPLAMGFMEDIFGGFGPFGSDDAFEGEP